MPDDAHDTPPPRRDPWPERHLTPGGFLTADADVDSVLASGTPQMWLAIWSTYQQRTFLQAMYHGSYDNTRDRNEYATQIADLAPVTALQALAADTRLTQQLTTDRWKTIRNAREAGATWRDIATSRGLSEQAAREEYERAITDREQRLPGPPQRGQIPPPDWHDTDRARAALDDPPPH